MFAPCRFMLWSMKTLPARSATRHAIVTRSGSASRSSVRRRRRTRGPGRTCRPRASPGRRSGDPWRRRSWGTRYRLVEQHLDVTGHGQDVLVRVRLERIEVEEEVVGMRHVVAARVERVHLDAAEVGHVEQRGRVVDREVVDAVRLRVLGQDRASASSPACAREPSSRRRTAPRRRRASASSSADVRRGTGRSAARRSSSRRSGRPSCSPRSSRRPCSGWTAGARVRRPRPTTRRRPCARRARWETRP